MKKIGLFFILGLILISFGFALGKSLSPTQKTVFLPTSSPAPTLTIASVSPQPTSVLGTQTTLYKVVKIIDGDTMDVEIDGKKETLRLIGIDTPETVDPRKPVQCFGKEASDYARALLTGKRVRLEKDASQGERDKYSRLLRYVFLEDGKHFNKIMIEQGYAHEYTYQTPYIYQREFKEAQKQAQEQKKGLWADNACSQTLDSTSSVPTRPTPGTSSGSYACNCSKGCTQITTCDEAYYQLTTCGCKSRDSDGDGVPCESLCR